VLLKNLYQFSLGILVWWLLGFGFSFSKVEGELIGKANFGGENWDGSLNFLNAALFGLIGMIVVLSVNNPLLERLQFYMYIVTSGLIMGFIYPVIAAWTWGGGWLSSSEYPILDYGGAGTVHILSGAMGLVGCLIAGPRPGRDKAFMKEFHPASYTLVVAGYFLFIVGLIFLNALQADNLLYAGNALFNSMLGGGVCSLTVYLLAPFINRQASLGIDTGLQGFLAGVIAMSSVAQRTEGWDAVCIGWFVGLFVAFAIRFLLEMNVDDPANHVSTQLVAGFIGLILVGVFDNEEGIFHNSDGKQLGYQVLGAVVILAWGAVWGLLIFGTAHAFRVLRISGQLDKTPMMRWGLSLAGYNDKEFASELQHEETKKPRASESSN
jgi:Amt family ammonium transporter